MSVGIFAESSEEGQILSLTDLWLCCQDDEGPEVSKNLELESPIVQICVAGPKLVVSCETKTVVCDTEAKTFRDETIIVNDTS